LHQEPQAAEITQEPIKKRKHSRDRRDRIVSAFSKWAYEVIRTQAIILSFCTLAIIGIMAFGVYIFTDMGYALF